MLLIEGKAVRVFLGLAGQKRCQTLLLAALRPFYHRVLDDANLLSLSFCSGFFPSWNGLLAPLPDTYSPIKALKSTTSSRKSFWSTPTHSNSSSELPQGSMPLGVFNNHLILSMFSFT